MVNLASLNQQQKTVVWSATAAVIFSTIFVLIAYFFIPLSLPLLDTQGLQLLSSYKEKHHDI